MATLAPGRRRRTASAITCEAEWRMRDSGSSGTSPLSRTFTGALAASLDTDRTHEDDPNGGREGRLDAAGNGVREGKAVGTGRIELPTLTVSR